MPRCQRGTDDFEQLRVAPRQRLGLAGKASNNVHWRRQDTPPAATLQAKARIDAMPTQGFQSFHGPVNCVAPEIQPAWRMDVAVIVHLGICVQYVARECCAKTCHAQGRDLIATEIQLLYCSRLTCHETRERLSCRVVKPVFG
mmetsp:Transcript_23035/g.71819  ORF Transcript_23035/g.71819 Transcript_23035/m.71819 type:complete len:143 (+) Transcript_23035:516-944(+)